MRLFWYFNLNSLYVFYKVKIFTFSSSAKPKGSSLSLVLIGDEFKKWVSFSFVKDKSKALIKSKLVKKKLFNEILI